MSGEARISELVQELGSITRRTASAGAVEHARDGTAFAAQPSHDVVELRLGADIADAARRTPDTGQSDRGDDWVRFAPKTWDQPALDRLDAWFRVAWRRAADR